MRSLIGLKSSLAAPAIRHCAEENSSCINDLSSSSIVAALSLVALGGAVLAAGGGGFGTPGTTTFQDLNATAQLTDSNGMFVFINVDRGVQTFKPRGGGPPFMVGPETVLTYSANSADGTTNLSGLLRDPGLGVHRGVGSLHRDPQSRPEHRDPLRRDPHPGRCGRSARSGRGSA